MGIYASDKIYGIKIYTDNENKDNYNIVTLYEIQSKDVISEQQKKEARLFYENLYNKQNIQFKIYTECSSTYREGTFMMWYSLSLADFLKYFDI